MTKLTVHIYANMPSYEHLWHISLSLGIFNLSLATHFYPFPSILQSAASTIISKSKPHSLTRQVKTTRISSSSHRASFTGLHPVPQSKVPCSEGPSTWFNIWGGCLSNLSNVALWGTMERRLHSVCDAAWVQNSGGTTECGVRQGPGKCVSSAPQWAGHWQP